MGRRHDSKAIERLTKPSQAAKRQNEKYALVGLPKTEESQSDLRSGMQVVTSAGAFGVGNESSQNLYPTNSDRIHLDSRPNFVRADVNYVSVEDGVPSYMDQSR